MSDWKPEEFQAHIAFMHEINRELTERGELAGAEGLAEPGRPGRCAEAPTASLSRRALRRDQGVPGRLLDGEVDGERAYAIAAQVSMAPGPGGKPLHIPVEVRQVMSGPPAPEMTLRTADVGHLLRDLAPQVLGAVARRHADFAAAEAAVQEALIAAAAQWPARASPDNPRGWLYQVAMRRMTDHQRSEHARRRREEAVAAERWAGEAFVPPPDFDGAAEEDDTLVLLFMCCHPA